MGASSNLRCDIRNARITRCTSLHRHDQRQDVADARSWLHSPAVSTRLRDTSLHPAFRPATPFRLDQRLLSATVNLDSMIVALWPGTCSCSGFLPCPGDRDVDTLAVLSRRPRSRSTSISLPPRPISFPSLPPPVLPLLLPPVSLPDGLFGAVDLPATKAPSRRLAQATRTKHCWNAR